MQEHQSIVREAWALLTSGGQFISGVYGSMVAMFLIRDTWPRRVAYAAASIPTSYYAAAWVTHSMGVTDGMAGVIGFVCGVFSLKLLQRVFIAAETADGSTLLGCILERVLGTMHKGPGQ